MYIAYALNGNTGYLLISIFSRAPTIPLYGLLETSPASQDIQSAISGHENQVESMHHPQYR